MSAIDKMMTRISALLAKAESTTFPEEATSYRAKAEELMRTYRIEEENLLRTQVSSSLPTSREIPIGMRLWEAHLTSMLMGIAEHCGTRVASKWLGEGIGYGLVTVGYDMDIRLVEMIFNAAKLAFLTALEPEFDAALSAEENIYRLRSSGMDRQTIALKVFGRSGHSEGIKVGKVYAEQCALRGEEPTASGRGFSRETYRESFAREFVWAMSYRLQRARDAADAMGGALVLPERQARVDEAFYQLFPSYRPMTPEQREAAKAKREAEEALNPRPAHKPRVQTAAARREMNRKYHSRSATAASRAAEAAANRVDIARAPSGKRIEDNGAQGSSGALGA